MARNFNGTSQYLVITSALLSSYPISLACWYKPVNNTGSQSLVSIGNTAATSYLLIYSVSGNLSARCFNTSSTAGSAISSATLTTGSWNHCVGVFTSATSRISYLNGVSASNATNVVLSAFNRTSIGANIDNSTTPASFANGSIASAAVWNTSLSSTNALSLYAGCPPIKVQPSFLVAYTRLIGTSPEPDIVIPGGWSPSG
jgi:Concanavalin A-like lectin/glucanases superfamily